MKAALRAEIRALRAQLKADDIAAWSQQIAERVQAMDQFRRARVVATYLAMPNEVQTAPLLAACHRLGHRICVPAYDSRAGCYRLAWLTANDDIVTVGRLQVPEPADPAWIAQPDIVNVVLTPGLAFDTAGRRLGFGRGGFDRLLEKVSAYKIGLAFEAQLRARVPTEAHDILMDAVVTEKEIYRRAERVARK